MGASADAGRDTMPGISRLANSPGVRIWSPQDKAFAAFRRIRYVAQVPDVRETLRMTDHPSAAEHVPASGIGSKHELHQELPVDFPDPLFRGLHRVIRFAIRVLAVLMVAVILWGVADVIYIIYARLMTPPVFLLDINDIFYTFGAFMAVLIAVEIFINIRLYLGTNVFPVQLVVATALMAIARKVIVLDFDEITPLYLVGIAAATLALGITYWLLRRGDRDHPWTG